MSPLALCRWLLLLAAHAGGDGGMKFILYNPLAAITNERAEEISQEFRHHDVLLLPGTQRKTEPDLACAKRRLNYHTEFSWGYKNKTKKHQSSAAGVSIYLTHRLARASIIREVLIPPANLQGRAAGLRLRASQMDILILVVYIPPRAAKTHRTLGAEILQWVSAQIGKVGTRTLPIVGGDFNDGVGINRGSNGQWQRAEHAGPYGQREKGIGGPLRELMASHYMEVSTTKHPIAPTFYGTRNSTSYVDHWCIPAGKSAKVRVLKKSMARLQYITSVDPRDHAPVELVLQILVVHQTPENNDHHYNKLDRDAMMNSYLEYGPPRADYIQKVEDKMDNDFRKEWIGAMSMNSPDGAWELLHKVVQEAAQEQFPQKAKEDDEYAELTKHRGKLLKQRANLRQVLRGAGQDAAADITLELTMVTRRCRKMRQTAAKDKERRLILEIWSAWRQRDFQESTG